LQLEDTLQKYFYVEQYPKTPEGKVWFLKALKSGAETAPHRRCFKRDPRYLILRLKTKGSCSAGQRSKRAAPRTRCDDPSSIDS
jgi:hypothetical protein